MDNFKNAIETHGQLYYQTGSNSPDTIAAATAVRKAVLEEAIEAANKIGNEFSEKSERAEIEDDAHYYDAVSVGAKRVFAALQRLVDEAS
jgi:hypothetical protein